MNHIIFFLSTVLVFAQINASTNSYEYPKEDKKFEKFGTSILKNISKNLRRIAKITNLVSMKFNEEEFKILKNNKTGFEFLKKKYKKENYLPLIEKNIEYEDGINEKISLLYARHNIHECKDLKGPVLNNAEFVQENLMKIRTYLMHSLRNQQELHKEWDLKVKYMYENNLKKFTTPAIYFRIFQCISMNTYISILRSNEKRFVVQHIIPKLKYEDKKINNVYQKYKSIDYSKFPLSNPSYPDLFFEEFKLNNNISLILKMTNRMLIQEYMKSYSSNCVYNSRYNIKNLRDHFSNKNDIDEIIKSLSVDNYSEIDKKYISKINSYTLINEKDILSIYAERFFKERNKNINVNYLKELLSKNKDKKKTFLSFIKENLEEIKEKPQQKKDITIDKNKNTNIEKITKLNTKKEATIKKEKPKYSFKKTTLKTFNLINEGNTNKIKWNNILKFFQDMMSQQIIFDVINKKNTLKVKFSWDMQSTFDKPHGQNPIINDPKMLKKISSNFCRMGINNNFIYRYTN